MKGRYFAKARKPTGECDKPFAVIRETAHNSYTVAVYEDELVAIEVADLLQRHTRWEV